MKVRELKELLAGVPDYHDVGIEVVDGDDTEVVPIEGKSDTRWEGTLSLVCKAPNRRVTLA